MINELIEQIGGRDGVEDMAEGNWPDSGFYDNVKLMARALLAVLDAQENSTIRKRKALLWLERQQMAHPGMNEVRYAIEILTSPPAVSTPEGWKLVPVEPTAKMMVAGTLVSEFQEDPAGMYRAMIAAAPSPGGDGG